MKTRSPNLFSVVEYDQQFKAWQKTTWKNEKAKRKAPSAIQLTKRIRDELKQLSEMPASEYELRRKWYELQEFKSKYTKEQLEEVFKRIWTPKGYSDFRRIDPELILLKDTIKSQKVDIWGNGSEREYEISDPLTKDYDILRTLVSRHRNAGVIGKQHRYLVRDRGTKKYIGVICISVDMLEPAGRDAIIGWTKTNEGKAIKKRTQPYCANGSTIVAIPPFSSAFNGGKLLSLLCLSDVVADNWHNSIGTDKKHYRLVHVMTTSLFGNETKQTMYDNLEPYWIRTKQETSGETAYELSPKLEQTCLDWILINDPKSHFDHFVAKKRDGSPKVRDPKDKAFKKLFSTLKIKNSEYMSGHKRGMYLAPLYENAYPFLREEIKEADLKKKLDNSVSALTKEWKFGLQSNSSGAKARIDSAVSRRRKQNLAEQDALKKIGIWYHRAENSKLYNNKKFLIFAPTASQRKTFLRTYDEPYWYAEMMDMSWEDAKANFL